METLTQPTSRDIDLQFSVNAEHAGLTLLQFLLKALEADYSGKKVKKALDRGACIVNGRLERFASKKVVKGDQVSFAIDMVEDPLKNLTPEALFEDEHLIVLNKPPGLDVDGVLKSFSEEYFLVHRLDKMTSGVMILAKSEVAKDALDQMFRNRKIEKTYLAWVEGTNLNKTGRIVNFLGCIRKCFGQKIMGVLPQERGGKKAITNWQVLKVLDDVTLVSVRTETGRTHQIRAHMSQLDHPIVGDFQYLSHLRSRYRPKRYLLHAASIAFTHPITKKSISFEVPTPKDFDL